MKSFNCSLVTVPFVHSSQDALILITHVLENPLPDTGNKRDTSGKIDN